MQFSLRQLLMVFPAFLVAWGMGYYLHYFLHEYNVRDGGITWIGNLQRSMKFFVESETIPARYFDELQPYFDGKLSIDHYWYINRPSFVWNYTDQDKPCDMWDGSFRVRTKFKTEQGTEIEWGIYSRGQDGITLTQGDDPDDISSWSSDGLVYYRNQILERRAIAALWHTLWLTPIIYGLMYGMWFLIWGKKSDEPVFEEAGHALDAN